MAKRWPNKLLDRLQERAVKLHDAAERLWFSYGYGSAARPMPPEVTRIYLGLKLRAYGLSTERERVLGLAAGYKPGKRLAENKRMVRKYRKELAAL